jgi:hypothetical protein
VEGLPVVGSQEGNLILQTVSKSESQSPFLEGAGVSFHQYLGSWGKERGSTMYSLGREASELFCASRLYTHKLCKGRISDIASLISFRSNYFLWPFIVLCFRFLALR